MRLFIFNKRNGSMTHEHGFEMHLGQRSVKRIRMCDHCNSLILDFQMKKTQDKIIMAKTLFDQSTKH